MNSLVNEFIYSKIKNKKSTMRLEPCTNYHHTLCHTTINLLAVDFFYNIHTNFIYDSHEQENDVTNYSR